MVAFTAAVISSSPRLWEGMLNQENFGGLFVGQLLASALLELFNRILALLDQRTQDLLCFLSSSGARLSISLFLSAASPCAR